MSVSRVRFLPLCILLMFPLVSCIFEDDPVSSTNLPVPGEVIVVRDTDDDGRGELFLINANGTNPRQIMSNQGYGMPVWSPDGMRLAGIANSSEGHPIAMIDVERQGITTLVVPAGSYEGIQWHPDGTGLVFAGIDQSRVSGGAGFIGSQLYSIDIETREIERLTTDSGMNYTGVGWSPDRQRIAWSDSNGLLIAHADGSDLVRVGDIRSAFQTTWSPDGSRIAFTGYPNEFGALYTVNADGTDLQRMVPDDFRTSNPAWSPDGRYLAFSRFEGRTTSLYVLDVASGDFRKIAEASGGIVPVWSPDGEWIAFITQFMDGESLGATHLSVVSTHDPNPRADTIVRDLMSLSSVAWRPGVP